MQTTSSQDQQTETAPRQDLYQRVTDTIIKQLEAGTVPWLRPWKGDDHRLPAIPYNTASFNQYQGINIVLLWGTALEKGYAKGDWGTFKQWSAKKEQIRKGEKGTMIVFTDTFEKEVDGESKKIRFLKSSVVFNRCQLASYIAEEKTSGHEETQLFEKVDKAETFIQGTNATIEFNSNKACYRPSNDTIYMPNSDVFIATDTCTATEGFYSTILHELVHWSGAEKRMDRKKGKKFGDQQYAYEELVAELGAAFLCAGLEMSTADKGSHAGYIDHWLKVLKSDKQMIVQAASEASKAVSYLHRLQPA